MLDRSTPNLFDPELPLEHAAGDSATVELEEAGEPDRGARPAPSRAPRPRRSRPAFSQMTGRSSRRLPSRLARAGRYLPVTIALLLLASHVFSGGHAKGAPAAAPATTADATNADPVVPAVTALAAPPAPVRTAVRSVHVRRRRTVRVHVAVAPPVHRVTRRRPVPWSQESVSASPAPGSTARVSTTPMPPPTPVPSAAPSPAPAPTPPAGHPSGEHAPEFGFEQ